MHGEYPGIANWQRRHGANAHDIEESPDAAHHEVDAMDGGGSASGCQEDITDDEYQEMMSFAETMQEAQASGRELTEEEQALMMKHAQMLYGNEMTMDEPETGGRSNGGNVLEDDGGQLPQAIEISEEKARELLYEFEDPDLKLWLDKELGLCMPVGLSAVEMDQFAPVLVFPPLRAKNAERLQKLAPKLDLDVRVVPDGRVFVKRGMRSRKPK